jgi:outer membrane lipoprotein-sorting protein
LIARKHLLAIAVTSFLAGCGGGSDSLGVDSGAAPQRVAAQAALLPGTSVTPEAAAEQLFAFAEGQLPGIFPGHPPTGSAGPFAYRAYPGGIFIGVVVTEDSPFHYGGVYLVGILGGTLAEPLYYAQLTDLIAPVVPGSGGGGSGNGCYDLALADTQGTHIEVGYQYSGSVTGTQNVDTVVGAMTTFQGQSARETTIVTSGTNFAQGFQVDGTFTGKNYAKRTGDAEITQYGSTFSGTGTSPGFGSATLNFTSVFNPAFVDQQYSLAVGQTFNASQTIATTGSVSSGGFSFPLDSTNTQSYAITYVGQEQVSVPAGTYSACKLQTTTTAGADVSTQTSWLIVGKGIPVKTTTTAGGITQTIEATSVKLNGSAI